MTFPAIFAIIVGLGMIGQWAASYIGKQIPELQSERYRPKTECPPGCSDEELIQIALTMEQQVFDFFQDSSDRLGFIEELPNVFDHLAEDHAQNQKTLQTSG